MQQQKLCLKWNNHTINLLSVLETFQSKDILVDVTLSCEGRNIKAHKMVLSACSPYFQNIFLENPCQHPIVIINGMKFEDITAILNFMYKGEVNVSHEGLSSFLQAAEALKVKGLAEVCGEKKGSNSNSIETEPIEQSRPQRIDTPNKKRHRNRKRSFSDSNRSDDEGAPRKIKEVNSPEVHELSGDESFTGDMSSNGQQLNSLTPRNVYSRSHQSSSNITTEDMDDEYEVEPSKMLEQTLTENANNSTSSDNGLRIERIVGNASEMESSSLQEPESPPDIKPIIEYGESSTVPLDGNMMVYNEQSQPGPSNIQDGSLLHDNSHTQDKIRPSKVNMNKSSYEGQPRNLSTTVRVYKCIDCTYKTTSVNEIRDHLEYKNESSPCIKRNTFKFSEKKIKCRKSQGKKCDVKNVTKDFSDPTLSSFKSSHKYKKDFQLSRKTHKYPSTKHIGKTFNKKASSVHTSATNQSSDSEGFKTVKENKNHRSDQSMSHHKYQTTKINKPFNKSASSIHTDSSHQPPLSKRCEATKQNKDDDSKLHSVGNDNFDDGGDLRADERRSLYYCDSCDYIFTDINTLTCHRNFHHKKYPYWT